MNLPPAATWGVIIPLVILELVLAITALVDLINRKPEQVRGSKILWTIIILLISTFGPAFYLVAGRKEA